MVILHREDTKNLNIPLFIESFPEKFIDASVFSRIREEAFLVPDGMRMPIEIPKSYTASDDEAEHRLWYFREDIGINLHHWHWHLVYNSSFTVKIIQKPSYLNFQLPFIFTNLKTITTLIPRRCTRMRHFHHFWCPNIDVESYSITCMNRFLFY